VYTGIPSNSFFSTILEHEMAAGGREEQEEQEEGYESVPSRYPSVFSPLKNAGSGDPFAPFDGDDAAPSSLPPPLISDPPAAAAASASLLWSRPDRFNSCSPQPPACPASEGTAFAGGAGGASDLLSLFPGSSFARGSSNDSKPGSAGIDMPPNSLETLHALTKALPGKRAPAFSLQETSNPWDNVPDQPLVR